MERGIRQNASGAIPFDSSSGKYFREEIQAPWFAYFLKDKGRLDFPEALTFEAGANGWRRWKAWPPTHEHPGAPALLWPERESVLRTARRERRLGLRRFRFGPGPPGSLPPPSHPATYFPGGSRWSEWLVEDQRFVDDRPDVLSWETAPLNRNSA